MELLAAIVAAAIVVSALSGNLGKVLHNLVRIERKLDRLLEHAGLPVDPTVSPAVTELVANNRRIEAIKQHRADTGAGLAEAKEAVDAAMARHRAKPS